MEPLHVVVHGHMPLIEDGLIGYLRGRPDFVVVSGKRLEQAQVIVLSAERLGVDVAARLRQLATTFGVPVVLVVDEIDQAGMLIAVECRVVAILPSRAVTADLLAYSVKAAAEGGGMMPTNLIGDLVKHVDRLHREVLGPHGLSASGLTPREIDVLRLMADGFDTAEIARKLSYSERTVKSVVAGLTKRLNLRNRAHAVAFALRTGII
ncbi:response regulator transcription factor [Actinoplanes sp. M2I2]|uniref:helix-turn-helix transcriptional regulator n=1 Tax=Actinoplanes sp. M2I2 TaxID=1734444 RepID=UPI0020206551|nr:response regulator transcription factor [Actinoplanes sp. M2I2]